MLGHSKELLEEVYAEQAKLADALREALTWIGQTRGELPGENERRGSNDERRRILEKGWDALKEHPFIKKAELAGPAQDGIRYGFPSEGAKAIAQAANAFVASHPTIEIIEAK
jgi:hypothetical protein